MKILIKNYTFDASQKRITFSDYVSIDLEKILLVTNTTQNKIIYNFACSGGEVSGNVLTVDYDTTTMLDTDKLQIFYEDTDINSSTEERQLEQISKQEDATMVLKELASVLRDFKNKIPPLTLRNTNALFVETNTNSSMLAIPYFITSSSSEIMNFYGRVHTARNWELQRNNLSF